MDKQDSGVLAAFAEKLDELGKCGGAEAQSLLRSALHDIYEQMSDELKKQAMKLLSEDQLIKQKLILFPGWNDESPPTTVHTDAVAQG